MAAYYIQALTGFAGIAATLLMARHLPDRVATHFSITGEPNAWSSNLSNTIFFCSIFLFMNLLFASIPWLIKKLPVSLINIPNRDYYLAPERRGETIERVGKLMAFFAIGVNIFLFSVEYLSFRANLSAAAMSSTNLLILGGAFLIFLILWIIRFVTAFRKP